MMRAGGVAADPDASGLLAVPGGAACAIRPHCDEPTCGYDFFTQLGDTLIWTGEPIPRNPALEHTDEDLRHRQISQHMLTGLQSHGFKSLASIDGAFCGLWYNGVTQRWSVFSDRMGLLPLFWAQSGPRLTVSPSAWLTWTGSELPLDVDAAAVADLVRCQNAASSRTLISNVHWLTGGDALTWNGHSIRIEPYWRLEPADASTLDDPAEAYLAVLNETVQEASRSSSPLWLGITGGIDSRMMLASCYRNGQVPDCFTAGLPFTEDVRFGRRLAKIARASHVVSPISEEHLADQLHDMIIATEGLHSASFMLTNTAIDAFLREHRRSILLEGYFHGIAAGAYVPAPDDALVDASRQPHDAQWARNRLHASCSFKIARQILADELAQHSEVDWQQRIDQTWYSIDHQDPLARAEYTVARNQMGRIDVLGTAMLNEHVWVRSPACNLRMLDWMRSVPPQIRHNKRICLEVLRKRFSRFSRVPKANSNHLPIAAGRLRREFCWQYEKLHAWWTRQRHSGLQQWASGQPTRALRMWGFHIWRQTGMLDVIRESNARIRPYIRNDVLETCWQRADTDGEAADAVMNLATVEIMLRWLEQQQQWSPNRSQSLVEPRQPVALTR
jgi:hypothetical protein